jgi:hypothetical protein
MFSDHPRKIDNTLPRILLWVAAGLVMVCQLVAMALVAGEQVQKAQMRGSSQASRQVAVASCVETSRGAAVRECLRLGSADLQGLPDTDLVNRSVEYGASFEPDRLDNVTAPATPSRVLAGFVPASFAAR